MKTTILVSWSYTIFYDRVTHVNSTNNQNKSTATISKKPKDERWQYLWRVLDAEQERKIKNIEKEAISKHVMNCHAVYKFGSLEAKVCE